MHKDSIIGDWDFVMGDPIMPRSYLGRSSSEEDVEGVLLKNRENAIGLLKKLVREQKSIKATQDQILSVTTGYAGSMATKEQMTKLLEANRQLEDELKHVRRIVESLSVRKHFRRLSLFAVCVSSLLVALTFVVGGELIFGLKFSMFLLLASILMFVIASMAPKGQ